MRFIDMFRELQVQIFGCDGVVWVFVVEGQWKVGGKEGYWFRWRGEWVCGRGVVKLRDGGAVKPFGGGGVVEVVVGKVVAVVVVVVMIV